MYICVERDIRVVIFCNSVLHVVIFWYVDYIIPRSFISC